MVDLSEGEKVQLTDLMNMFERWLKEQRFLSVKFSTAMAGGWLTVSFEKPPCVPPKDDNSNEVNMGPKEQEKYDELYAEYKAARANGEMGRAIRLLTRLNRIENGESGEEVDDEDES